MPAPRQTAAKYGADAQKAAALLRKEKKEIEITGKQKVAVELMVFEGMERKDAAEAAGMSDATLQQALRRPHVLAHLNECQEVLRTSARPRALNQVIKLMTKAGSERVQLDAAKYIDGMDRGAHQVGATTVNVNVNQSVKLERAGYVIDLTPYEDEPAQAAPQITHLEHDEDK